MWYTLALTGGLLGLALAALLHIGFGRLRPHPPLFFQGLGWLVMLGLTGFGGMGLWCYLGDPEGEWAIFTLFVSLLAILPVLVCAGLGSLQARTVPMSWPGAFSLLMAEYGIGLLTVIQLYRWQDTIADILRQLNWDIGEPYSAALHLTNCFVIAMLSAALLLKSIPACLGSRE